MTSGLRVAWQKQIVQILDSVKREIESTISVTVTITWDDSANVVEPNIKINSRLQHHAPHLIPGKNGEQHTDSKSIATAAIREIWDKYRRDFARVIDYNLWMQDNTKDRIQELSKEEFIEFMRMKRERDGKRKEKTDS